MDRLCNARNVIIEMCDDRKYEKTQEKLNYPAFLSRFSSAVTNPTVLNFVTSKNKQPVAVHFTYDEKLAKAALEKILNDYTTQGIESIILITLAKLNPSCKALVANSKMMIELFLVAEIQSNISKHELVVPHRILSDEEKEELFKKYKLKEDGMPVILTTDMMCRYIGGRVNDVVEIERESLTAGKSFYYRIVKRS